MALELGCNQVNRHISRVARPSLEKTRSFPQAWDVMMEVGESPGYQDAQSSGSGRKFLFQAQQDGFQVVLRLLQGFRVSRDFQCGSDDVIVQWVYYDWNRAIGTVYA